MKTLTGFLSGDFRLRENTLERSEWTMMGPARSPRGGGETPHHTLMEWGELMHIQGLEVWSVPDECRRIPLTSFMCVLMEFGLEGLL